MRLRCSTRAQVDAAATTWIVRGSVDAAAATRIVRGSVDDAATTRIVRGSVNVPKRKSARQNQRAARRDSEMTAKRIANKMERPALQMASERRPLACRSRLGRARVGHSRVHQLERLERHVAKALGQFEVLSKRHTQTAVKIYDCVRAAVACERKSLRSRIPL